jgi:hypothetical protein
MVREVASMQAGDAELRPARETMVTAVLGVGEHVAVERVEVEVDEDVIVLCFSDGRVYTFDPFELREALAR